MKKIIALAVAGAFVAPAYAADITLGGEVEYYYTNADGAEDTLTDAETNLFLSASSELDNGMSIKANINFRNRDPDATNSSSQVNGTLEEGGSKLTLGLMQYGTLEIGDTSGAIDNFDDVADQAAQSGDSVSHADAGIAYTLPVFVEGLTIRYAMTPAGGATIGGSTDMVTDDYSGIAAKYVFGNYSVYYGVDNRTASGTEREDTGLGATAAFGPISAAIETQETRFEDGVETTNVDELGMAVSYSMGATTFVLSTYDRETGSTKDRDEQTVSVFQDLGEGVTVYVENKDDSAAGRTNQGQTVAGIEYKF